MAEDFGDASPSNENEYWAVKPLTDLVDELKGQERGWWSAGTRRGYWDLLRLIYAQAQGMDPNGSPNAAHQLRFAGVNASFVRFRVQLTRSHIKQRNVMAQGERPAFQCLSLNDDYESLAQVQTAQAGIDYVFRQAKGESVEWKALEADGYFGEGFIWGRWDPNGGADIKKVEEQPVTNPDGSPQMMPEHAYQDAQTGQLVIEPEAPATQQVEVRKKAGTPTLTALYPWEVVRDPYARDCPWVMVREIVSKLEHAAQYPDQSTEILEIDNLRAEAGIAEMFAYDIGATTSDQIIVRHFYHKACPAVPNGRYVGVAGDVPLWDLPCPLPEGLPLVSICSAKYFATAFGYPESADLLSIQEMIDELYTQSANNVLRYGNQSLWAEDGVEVDMKALARGGGFFNYKTGQEPPKTIQWAQIPQATEYLLENLPNLMNFISGMNSVARGQPDANIQSGTFAALMLNIAQKFVSATEQSLDAARNDVGNMLLKFLQANADAEFVGVVAGANQAPYLRLFKGSDFGGIERVQVETSSPLMRTIPGRFEVFNAIKNITNKQERAAAYTMLVTGNSNAYTESDVASEILIQWENEQLSKGIWCEVAVSDDPVLHNLKHKASFDRLRAMPPTDDPKEIQLRITAQQMHQQHMAKHGLGWAMSDPIFCDSVQIPRPALPWNPYGTLPVQGISPDTGAQGAPQGQSSMPGAAGSGMPAQPDPAQPPDNANTANMDNMAAAS